MSAIKVGVFGAGGRMGRAVCAAVVEEAGLDLVAAVDPHFAGIDIGEVAGVAAGSFDVAASPEALNEADVQVAIDFTHLDAAKLNLEFCARNDIHAVIGTSGFTESDFKSIDASFTSSGCLIAPNFAIGAVLMMRFAELAAPYFETAEIIELHHDGKVDAPSGTAVGTAERIAHASGDWAADPTETETIPGARGAKGPAGISIHSIRMRGMVAHQEVLLGATGQTLSLRHDSYDRSSFMPGVMLAALKVGDNSPGLTIGLDGVMGI